MTEQLKKLLELQDLDGKIRGLRTLSEDVPAALLKKRTDMEAKKSRLSALEADTKNKKADIHRLEGDLKSSEEKVTKLEIQLNSAQTNREYSTLQGEIGGIKADASRVEDKVLESMAQIDELVKKKEALRREIETESEKCRQLEEESRRRTGELDEELKKLSDIRAGMAEGVKPDLLALYERILENKGDVAVVSTDKEICQGCFVGVTKQTVNLLLQGRELVRCSSCSRILYLEEGEAASYRNSG